VLDLYLFLTLLAGKDLETRSYEELDLLVFNPGSEVIM